LSVLCCSVKVTKDGIVENRVRISRAEVTESDPKRRATSLNFKMNAMSQKIYDVLDSSSKVAQNIPASQVI